MTNLMLVHNSHNFNPRSHKGSDYISIAICILIFISIHAPTRGATWRRLVGLAAQQQFQSTLPQGERRIILDSTRPVVLFQSTLPQGERPGLRRPFPRYLIISIHAPTRGATVPSSAAFFSVTDFNPRSHKGSDLRRLRYDQCNHNFNPRSHKGSDLGLGATLTGLAISIHAPTRGATSLAVISVSSYAGFQSTLPQGERRCHKRLYCTHDLFQSTLPQGERPTRDTRLI